MKNKAFIVLGVIIIILVIIIDSITPKEIIWEQTYNEKDTNPFDLEVFHDQLDSIFNTEKVITLKNTFYEYYQDHPLETLSSNNIYINIDTRYKPDPSSENNLLEFIGKGNIAFISATHFSDSLLDTLNIHKNYKSHSFYNADSLNISVDEITLKYENKFKFSQGYFKDSTNLKSLGNVFFTENDSISFKKTNFIKVSYQKGLFYLHTQPEIFTNYHLLSIPNTDYINKILSSIPKSIANDIISDQSLKHNVYFESNFKTNDELINDPLRFIKTNKELYTAWILVLIGIGLFLIINAKRKQRIIPIISKVRNTSLDFVETISILYEEADNFQPMIHHKINIFYKDIRNTYNVITDKTNSKLAKQLSLKSGYDFKKTKELIRFINALKIRETSSIVLLKKLNKEIEDFNKTTNAWKKS